MESQINNYYYSLEYTKLESYDEGESSGRAYSNTTGQEISGIFGIPLGESFQFATTYKQSLSTQPYTESSDEYKSYKLIKNYNFILAYIY